MLTSELALAQEGTKLGNRKMTMVYKSEWDIREALDWQSKGSRGENERASLSNRLSTVRACAACAACYCLYGKVGIVCTMISNLGLSVVTCPFQRFCDTTARLNHLSRECGCSQRDSVYFRIYGHSCLLAVVNPTVTAQ